MNALVSNMDIGVISVDKEGFITLVNGKAMECLDLNGGVKELIGTEVLFHLHDTDLYAKFKECIENGRCNFQLESLLVNDRYLNINGRKLLDGMLLSIVDVTSNVMAKDQATQYLLLGQETERRRLAKEIHDGVGPNMSTIKLQIDAVKRKAQSKTVIVGLEEINEAISSIATDIRQISHDLMPSSLIDFGVVTALSNFAKKISESSDIEVHYQCNFKDGELSKAYKLNIFRIVQELVNNALKYSNCKNIEISLRMDKEGINLLVQDDGVGMELDKEVNGVGLSNVRSRIESLHGEFELDSIVGRGVSVHISLPPVMSSIYLNL